MDNKVKFSTLWHAAGIAGIALAAVSIIYMLATNWIGPATGWKVVLSFLLWTAKLVACVWLMWMFLNNFHKDNPQAERADVRKLGLLIAALSALVFATMEMAYYRMNPETITDAIKQAAEAYPQLRSKNARDAIDATLQDIPTYIFFAQFIYCFVFGWVLSAILSFRVIKDNPFADRTEDDADKSDDDEEEPEGREGDDADENRAQNN